MSYRGTAQLICFHCIRGVRSTPVELMFRVRAINPMATQLRQWTTLLNLCSVIQRIGCCSECCFGWWTRSCLNYVPTASPGACRLANRISEYLRERITPSAPPLNAARTASRTSCFLFPLASGEYRCQYWARFLRHLPHPQQPAASPALRNWLKAPCAKAPHLPPRCSSRVRDFQADW